VLRDECFSIVKDENTAWVVATPGEAEDWRQIDRRLRGFARARAALDAEEARWIREAERVQIWRPLGMVSMVDYLERALGYAPRTARQRLQVARALAALPVMTDALANGELPFSAVRELVRVATPETEAAWVGHVGQMTLRQIEEAVSGHAPGDLPDDPADPDLAMHEITLRVTGATYALWRQHALALDVEHAHHLDDDELVAALCTPPRAADDGEVNGRAKYQVALTVCQRCDRAWQDGAGVQVAVDAATLERARCDAQHIGSLDGAAPERAHQDIPPATVRFIWRRDHGRCRVPGCRSARALEIHHIVRRADGGSHDPSNLCLLCSSCHAAHHRGALTISGIAPDRIRVMRSHTSPVAPRDPTMPGDLVLPGAGVVSRAGAAPSAPPRPSEPSSSTRTPDRFAEIARRTQARDALVRLGWKSAIAVAAVDAARASIPDDASLEVLLREALRHCPVGWS
jgi:5-methylcytosine-specific restriction endonuclease McrA